MDDYRNIIDGMVVAFPQFREDIDICWYILNDVINDTGLARPREILFPSNTSSKVGDFVSVATTAQVVSTQSCIIHFRERDDCTGATSGYHFKQFLVDTNVVWAEDVAGGTNSMLQHDLDLTGFVQGKSNVVLTFRLLDKKGVSNFGVNWYLQGLSCDGIQPISTFSEPSHWSVQKQGAFQAGFGDGINGQRQFQIPAIVMTVGTVGAYQMRNGYPASPELVAEQIGMCLHAEQDGKFGGVVTYCLDKRTNSLVFPLVKTLFQKEGILKN